MLNNILLKNQNEAKEIEINMETKRKEIWKQELILENSENVYWKVVCLE